MALLEQSGTTVLITTGSSTNQMTSITVNSAMFTFTRTFAQEANSPLTSTLSIDSIGIGEQCYAVQISQTQRYLLQLLSKSVKVSLLVATLENLASLISLLLTS